MNVSIISIGDELLIGQTIDTNSAWIAQQLNGLGIDVLRRIAVGDTRTAITEALDEERVWHGIELCAVARFRSADHVFLIFALRYVHH